VTNNSKYSVHAKPSKAEKQPAALFLFMRSLLFLISFGLTLGLAAGVSHTRGVHPSLLSKYRPKGTTWTCLDGVKTIPWTAVNDDYCDCLDGSDEPGATLFAMVSPKPYKLNQERVRALTIPSTARMKVISAQTSQVRV